MMNQSVLGYLIEGHCNDLQIVAYRNDIPRCQGCGQAIDKWNVPLAGLRLLKRRNKDISITADGFVTVSHKFLDVCNNEGLTGLNTKNLPDDPEFTIIYATETVPFDAERRKTRFENYCATCNRYYDVIGATPVYLRVNVPLPERAFSRTDIEFASGDEKSPLLLCGVTAAEVLKSNQISGLELMSIIA